MRATRIAVSAALLGALALPIATATTATAAPGSALVAQSCNDPGPWVVGTKAVTIRSKASAKSTAVGVLYRGHKFTVHKTSGKWRYITDRTTGVKGWVSAAYVYRDVPMCLD
ncbi:SH3 domain-containing protein [Streptomyces sp. PBH53]|uniref:SH3 domain-containing protein n=1 Tax=Streptomyces sp. PBH53 TaxID=1577075 RepID=UPI000A59B9B8|nr:SH3 domain-containing protein [Streptomyces sp. PBH53]